MGIIYRSNKWDVERVQNGIIVEINKSDYKSVFSPDIKEVYTGIRFTEESTNKVLYAYEWINSNLCIFPSTYERFINAFLLWVTEENPDAYSIERTAEKAFFKNSCVSLLVYMERKNREKMYKAHVKTWEEMRS